MGTLAWQGNDARPHAKTRGPGGPAKLLFLLILAQLVNIAVSRQLNSKNQKRAVHKQNEAGNSFNLLGPLFSLELHGAAISTK